jgi:hypothetical protein
MNNIWKSSIVVIPCFTFSNFIKIKCFNLNRLSIHLLSKVCWVVILGCTLYMHCQEHYIQGILLVTYFFLKTYQSKWLAGGNTRCLSSSPSFSYNTLWENKTLYKHRTRYLYPQIRTNYTVPIVALPSRERCLFKSYQ